MASDTRCNHTVLEQRIIELEIILAVQRVELMGHQLYAIQVAERALNRADKLEEALRDAREMLPTHSHDLRLPGYQERCEKCRVFARIDALLGETK